MPLVAQLYELAMEHADKLTPAVIAAMAPATIVVYFIGLIFYRLWLHPLSSVPGPFWNRITFLAEFHYSGTMYIKIDEWHKKYGPIIRISPDEVHVDDSLNIETFDQCHRVGTKWSKPNEFYGKFRGDNAAVFTIVGNAEHRARRSAIHPIFSRKAVASLEPFVHDIVTNLCKRISSDSADKPGSPFNMYRAFRCVALDTITSYSLGKSLDILHTPDLGKDFVDTVRGHLASFWLFRALPMPVVYFITHLPPFIAEKLDTSGGILPRIRQEAVNTVARVKKDPDFRGTHGGKTAFHDMIWASESIDASIIPEELDAEERKWLLAAQKENKRNTKAAGSKYLVPEDAMVEEMGAFVVAGVDSTGTTMEQTLLALLTHPEQKARLLKELKATFPGGPETFTWQGLERIPYMAGVIKEGLRLANGVIGRLPRVVEEDGIEFKGHKLPKGSIVSQSTRLHHRHPELFPDPDSFVPERWLAPDAKKLEKYLNPFGKGSRSCAGRELAMCEVYLAVACVIATFPEMKIAKESGFQTLQEVPWVDNFLTFYPEGNPGLQVVV